MKRVVYLCDGCERTVDGPFALIISVELPNARGLRYEYCSRCAADIASRIGEGVSKFVASGGDVVPT